VYVALWLKPKITWERDGKSDGVEFIKNSIEVV
jgi:hypothetical protein